MLLLGRIESSPPAGFLFIHYLFCCDAFFRLCIGLAWHDPHKTNIKRGRLEKETFYVIWVLCKLCSNCHWDGITKESYDALGRKSPNGFEFL
jgi:hypothetical protein